MSSTVEDKKRSVTVPGVRNHAIEIQVATDGYSKTCVFSQHLLNNTTFINVPIQCPSLSRSVCIFAKIWKGAGQICFASNRVLVAPFEEPIYQNWSMKQTHIKYLIVVFQSRLHLQHAFHIIRTFFLWHQIYERCHCLVAFFGGNVYNSYPGLILFI